MQVIVEKDASSDIPDIDMIHEEVSFQVPFWFNYFDLDCYLCF